MNTLTSLISDGEGNTSTMRVIVILVVLAVVVSKFYNAWVTKEPVAWSTQDWEIISTVIGGKLVQNVQEKTTTPPKV